MVPSSNRPAPRSNASEPVDVTASDAMLHSLHSAVYARRSEYVRPHRVRLKVGTWNVAACPGTDHDLATWFVSGKGVDHRLSNIIAASSNGALQRETSDTAFAGQEQGVGEDVAAVRVMGSDQIGLYALGLQEVVDLNVASQYMNRVYTDSNATVLDRWKTALGLALPDGYKLVASEQMSGLLLLIYASPEVAGMVSHVSTSAVGTGLLGLMGNKGAVSANIVLGESTRMVFVNSHLASGNEASHADRRCWDVSHIASRTQFEPYNHPGLPETKEPEKIADADFAFWFGDLNFRLDDLPGDDIRRILTLHARGEYDLNQKLPVDSNRAGSMQAGDHDSLAGEEAIVLQKPTPTDSRSNWASSTTKASADSISTTSTALANDDGKDAVGGMKLLPPLPDPDEFLPDASEDPASLQATLDSLLPHDQLGKAIRERKAFHDGWREGRITFLPSYKYDVGTVGLFDSSEKRRAPSWCDRILYRTRKDKDDYEQRVKDKEEAEKRDKEMTQRGLDHAGDDDEVLFEYQPDIDGDDLLRRNSTASSLDYDEYDDGEYNPDKDNETAPQDGVADRIHLDIYASHQRIQSSDHKPVVSLFTVDCDAVVPELKAAVHMEVARELDRTENESRPGVTIVVDSRVVHDTSKYTSGSDEAVDFGLVVFLQKASTSLTIANTGGVPAVLSFVEKPTTEDLASSDFIAHPYQWLTTSFIRQDKETDEEGPVDLGKEVILEPGETVNALLEVFVSDVTFARMLNDGVSKLEDVLVLRVDEGKDHFVPVRGTWAPTCIGRSIEELVRVPDGGIRAFVATLHEELAKKNGQTPGADTTTLGSISYDLDVRCAAPKELFKLTEMIENLVDRSIADEQMLKDFKIPGDKVGWPFEDTTRALDNRHIVAVIEALDEDRPVLDAFEPEMSSLLRLEVVSHVLLLFLQGLTDGIVTISLWSQIDQATLLSLNGSKSVNPIARDPNSETDKSTVLDFLSSTPHHNISFVFLTTTLSRIIGELSPLSLGDLDALRSIGRSSGGGFSATMGGIGSIGRRSLSSFRKSGVSPASAALEALDRRMARERRYAEIFGGIMCRVPAMAKDRERKAQEDKQRAVVELFLKRSREELGGQ
ncbi:PI phosphatase group protein [Sporothrix schenckii 1099-18]|uniref:PI phosphatase group protein n=1 Tax=Sporothrix schenckii 1099-18 TaxID=1397361 RepID=A0A0F2MD74_SPOSC|nr:PI phosphatase group protein [Sporothrix schenckii 1099-18]KJR87648.1 PI phosphatase group protein [Sporothrix schenckii 1099-18]